MCWSLSKHDSLTGWRVYQHYACSCLDSSVFTTPSLCQVLETTGVDDDDENCVCSCLDSSVFTPCPIARCWRRRVWMMMMRTVQLSRQQRVHHPIPAPGAGEGRCGWWPGEGASQPGQPAARHLQDSQRSLCSHTWIQTVSALSVWWATVRLYR